MQYQKNVQLQIDTQSKDSIIDSKQQQNTIQSQISPSTTQSSNKYYTSPTNNNNNNYNTTNSKNTTSFTFENRYKMNSSMSNLKSILQTSSTTNPLNNTIKQQQQMNTPPMTSLKQSNSQYGFITQSSPQSKQLINLNQSDFNHMLSTSKDTINIQQNGNQSMNQDDQIIHKSNNKLLPFSSYHHKTNSEIPRSSFNFNLDSFHKKSSNNIIHPPTPPQSTSNKIQSLGINGGGTISSSLLTKNTSETINNNQFQSKRNMTPNNNSNSNNNYFSRSSYLPQHQQSFHSVNINNNNTQQTLHNSNNTINNSSIQNNNNTNNINNTIQQNKTNPISVNQIQSILNRHDLGHLQGAILTESQTHQKQQQSSPHNFSSPNYTEPSSSIVNISHIIQQPVHDEESMKFNNNNNNNNNNSKIIKPQQSSQKTIGDQYFYKKDRSLSRDRKIGYRKEVTPQKYSSSSKKNSHNNSRNTSENKIDKSQNNSQINTIPEIKSNKSITIPINQEEPRKFSSHNNPPYLGIKNANINLANITSSASTTTATSQINLITQSQSLQQQQQQINPPVQPIQQQNAILNMNLPLQIPPQIQLYQQCQTPTNQLSNQSPKISPIHQSISNQSQGNNNSSSNRYSDNGQQQLQQQLSLQNQGSSSHSSQKRKCSLIGFSIPKQSNTIINNSQQNIKQLSKQNSSVLFPDIDDNTSSYNGRTQQKSQTNIFMPQNSPGRNRFNQGSQGYIQDQSPKLKLKNLELQSSQQSHSPLHQRNQSSSPTKSLFQMVKLQVTHSNNNDSSTPMMMSGQISPLKSRSKKARQSTMSFSNEYKDGFTKERSGNVKTCLRFRPNNKMELELTNQGMGSNVISFIDDYSVSINGDSSNVYTVDKVYRQTDTQETIYNQVGKEVIEDVFQGYNGTIFTYGVTGSGKTHTMFGNLTDNNEKGIIPRISDQIFDLVLNDDDGTEFIINCSMLEIYKEILYDSFNDQKQELKIKENAQRGIYVQGLTQTSIATQEEIVQLITIGYNTKRTRETRLNEYSSRSHTIFMIEISQRLSNGDEKVGKINLIDLAGAEKVSKSGAQGESLEEAIKINLSLSNLGKVIHSLTNGNDYIPYRDSKLTRILQESLGGNYKTSLIVTCSMHSSFQEDTISALKFATRAKKIKNTFKINIKLNPQNLQKEVESLRMQTENFKYILQNVKTIFSETQNKIISLPNSATDPKLSEIKNKLEEFLSIQNIVEDLSGKSCQEISLPSTNYDNKQFIANLLTTKKEALNMVKDENIRQLQQQNQDQQEKIESMQQDLQDLKRQNLNLTAKVNELSQEKNQLKLKLTKQLSQNNYATFSVEILQKQIQHLVDSVCKAEKKVTQTLKEKKDILDIKFEDYLKENLTFSEIKLADYFKNTINFNFESAEKGYKDVQQNIKRFNLDGEQDFMNEKSMDIESSSFAMEGTESLLEAGGNNYKKPRQSHSLANNSFVNNIDTKIFQNENNDILKKIFDMPTKLDMISSSDAVSTDFIIISLKKQLIDTHILNQNLLRTVNALEWKQIIEYGKQKLKSDQIQLQKKQIKQLELVLDEVTDNHKELRLKIEDLEFDMYQQANSKQSEFISDNNHDQFKQQMFKNKIIIPLTPSNAIRSQLLSKQDPKKNNFVDNNISNNLIKSVNISRSSISDKINNQKDLLFDLQTSLRLLELDIVPLTYDNALEELKKRNNILKKLIELNLLDQSYFETPQKETNEFIKNERERLNNKIVILQQELKMEQVKVESFKHSLLVERKNMKDLKKLNEEMEISLRNNLKEENECWQKTINEISEQNKIELTKRQSEYNQLKEIFYNLIEISLQKVQELKHRWSSSSQSNEFQELENIISEMDKAKQHIGKSYEIQIKKRQRNSSAHSIPVLTPKKPIAQPPESIHSMKPFLLQQ